MYKIIIFATTLLICSTIFANENQSIDVCFSPNGNCAEKIIAAINQAHQQILVQAYSFSSKPIVAALVSAKKHGVKVEVIVDKGLLQDNNWVLNYLLNNDIPIYVDYLPRIAHSKTMIIDNETVVTGSYNFTPSAEYRNVENSLIIHDGNLSKKYTNNWLKRESLSKPVRKLSNKNHFTVILVF